MSAKVEILVAERDNTLSLPAKAVLHYDGKDHVAIKNPDGRFEWRDVKVGDSNEMAFEINQGITPGERVALDPTRLLTEEGARRPSQPSPFRGTIRVLKRPEESPRQGGPQGPLSSDHPEVQEHHRLKTETR